MRSMYDLARKQVLDFAEPAEEQAELKERTFDPPVLAFVPHGWEEDGFAVPPGEVVSIIAV